MVACATGGCGNPGLEWTRPSQPTPCGICRMCLRCPGMGSVGSGGIGGGGRDGWEARTGEADGCASGVVGGPRVVLRVSTGLGGLGASLGGGEGACSAELCGGWSGSCALDGAPTLWRCVNGSLLAERERSSTAFFSPCMSLSIWLTAASEVYAGGSLVPLPLLSRFVTSSPLSSKGLIRLLSSRMSAWCSFRS